MKISKILCSAFLLIGISAPQLIKAQALEEGNITISPYYGFPNLFTTTLKASYGNTGFNEDVGGIGPIGLRGEYMATDNIGIGIDINYANTHISWQDDFWGPTYDYKVEVPRLRAMARFNFHFGNSDVFDFYGGVGAGYSSFKVISTTNDPDYINDELTNPFPVAFRIALGTTFFFTDYLGASLELGLGGGALMHFGVTARL